MTEMTDTHDKDNEQDDFEIEIEEVDDTPEEDKGREPLPKEIVEELENDELDEYSEKVKQRLKAMKKAWHDERRAKEKLEREGREAVAATQRLLEENRRYRHTLSEGEKAYIAELQRAAKLEVEVAKKMYRDAQDLGDTDKIIEAQEKFNEAVFKSQQAGNFVPTLHGEDNTVVNHGNLQATPAPDAKTNAWQERNTWFGSDTEMTASALGLHQSLIEKNGAAFAGTDEYWKTIDNTMAKRFPEYFGEAKEKATKPKAATVVAPATRSRSPKKVTLTASQVSLAKKLGITPEAYAKEMIKLENSND